MSSLAGCIKTLVPTKRQKNIKNDLNALSIDLRKDTTSKKESDLQAVIATIAELNEEKETIRKAILAKLKPQSKVEESNGKEEKQEGRKGLLSKDKTSTELAQSSKEGVLDSDKPTQQMNTKENVELVNTDEATRQDPENKPTQQAVNNDELKLQAMKLNNRIEKLYELLTCLG